MQVQTSDMGQRVAATEASSITSGDHAILHPHRSTWLRLTAVAALSAFTGGLAAAWYYRKTLSRLQEAELEARNSNFGMYEPPDGEAN